MRSRAIQIEFGIRLVIDQQPIRLNVAFPMRDIAARQAVVLVLGLKCGRDCQHVDDLLQQVINVLAVPAALQPQNKDHSLTGSYIPHRECHIQPDWLLIYYQTDAELYLYRTGTHADLFGL